MASMRFFVVGTVLWGTTLGLAGCAPAPPRDATVAAPDLAYWEIYYLQGNRVGHGSASTRREVESDGAAGRRETLRIESVGRLAIRRGGQTNQQEIRVASVETPDGRLLGFESALGLAPSMIRTTGRVRNGRIEMETTGKGAAPIRNSIPWSADLGGPFAVEQSLARRPMRPGERRALKMLAVDFLQAAEVELRAREFETVSLPSGSRELLRVEAVMRLPDGQSIEQTLWVDRAGATWKISSAALGGLESIRVSKAEALAQADGAEFDLLSKMTVKIGRPLPKVHESRRQRYRVRLDRSDPASVFAVGPSQSVRSLDANTAEITVYAIHPGQPDGNPDAPGEGFTDDDLRPNLFIQSDDPKVAADAREAAGDETDPWRVAVALERFVHDAVKRKDFSQTFATAAEVARSREGDCTEHAVYLAALARARGIPARVAVGLVYMEREQAFGYHLWTEVFIQPRRGNDLGPTSGSRASQGETPSHRIATNGNFNMPRGDKSDAFLHGDDAAIPFKPEKNIGGRWIPIDGTLALGGIGAGHLKIAQSNLHGANSYAALLPVVKIFGRLEIQALEER